MMDANRPTDPSDNTSDMVMHPTLGIGRSARIVRTLEHAADLDQFERMLLTVAVGPNGPRFDRAHLMTWDAATGLLFDRHRAWGGRASAALECGGLAAAAEQGPPSNPDARGVSPARLSGPAAIAWHEGHHVVAPGTGSTPHERVASVIGAAPLRRKGSVFGLLVGEWFADGPTAERRAALEDMVQLTEAALDAYGRTRELARRTRHAASLAELTRATISPLNVAEVLHLVTRLAAQSVASGGGALWLVGKTGPRLEVTHGASGQRERFGRALQPIANAVIEAAKPRIAEPATDELLLSPEASAELTMVAVFPLIAYDRTLGALGVYQTTRSHPSETGLQDELDFLSTLADLAALALDQAGRFQMLEQVRQKNRELASALRRRERLSSLGELSVQVSHEAKNPLASIRAFARRVHQSLGDNEPGREYLEIVLRETDRLERLLREQHECAIVEPPAMRLESLNDIVQHSLQEVGETLVRRRIRLLKKLSPEVPTLLLDAERVRRLMANVLHHALEVVSVGGRIRVETRRLNQHAVVEVGHDGPHAPGDVLEQLFVPFASSRPGGPAVGLALAQRIVREHGGEIRVRSEGEWSTLISFTVPILDNRDRRRPGTDRRHLRADRRARLPEA